MDSANVTAAVALGASAFMVGLSGAMSPGPYLTLTITRTLRNGPVSALLMLVGHALLEAALLIGFAFGLQEFLKAPTVASGMALLGGIVLLWMGFDLLRGAWRGDIAADLHESGQKPTGNPVIHGALISISNPYWTLWWATIGIKLAADGLAIGAVGVVAFFIGHQLADIVWYSFVVIAVSRGRGRLSDRLYRTVIAGLALFLLVLGASFILDGLGL